MTIVLILVFGLVVGLGMHFLLPYQFSRILVDASAGVLGSAIGAVLSSPFSPPGEIAQKIAFLIASIVGAGLAVLIARALKI
jgi:uncharacterized membrane protein YeaQ/YmgE (transglycosylase-associated protein family)